MNDPAPSATTERAPTETVAPASRVAVVGADSVTVPVMTDTAGAGAGDGDGAGAGAGAGAGGGVVGAV